MNNATLEFTQKVQMHFPQYISSEVMGRLNGIAVEELTKQLGAFCEVLDGRAIIVLVPLLEFVGTATVVATEESVVLTPEVLLERYNIKWRWGMFDECFLGKTIDPFGGSTLGSKRLRRNSVDGSIIAELGGAIAGRTFPVEMLSLVEAQKNGEAGPLLTDRCANIAYWEDQVRFPDDEQVAYTNEAGEKVVLRTVSAYWRARGGGWAVDSRAVTNFFEWIDGSQFFSRNSR